MRSTRRPGAAKRWATAGVVAVTAVVAAAGDAYAQVEAARTFTTGGRWLAGYVVNAPQELLGFGTAFTTLWLGGIGLYVDAKTTVDDPADEVFHPDLTADSAAALGDLFLGPPKSAWRTVNIALVKVIGPELAIYGGGGLSERNVYLEYTDQTRERSESGRYWVKDETDSGTYPTVIGGGFLRLSNRIIFQFGGEAAPFGVTVGFHIALR